MKILVFLQKKVAKSFIEKYNETTNKEGGSKIMNKTELVSAIAEQAGLSKKDAEAAVKAFVNVVSTELQKGEKVQLIGFGTFETGKRAARTGRNPQTGAEIKIAEAVVPKFKAGSALKDLVNTKPAKKAKKKK